MFNRNVLKCISVTGISFFLFTGCFDNSLNPKQSNGEPINQPISDKTGNLKLFVVESDFQSGYLEWMSTDQNAIQNQGISIYSDATVKSFGGYVYVLEKYGADNVLKFDPTKNDESGVIYQEHLGNNWNPQDIEFVSDTKAYISNANEPEITIFNPATGAVEGHIDISMYTFLPNSNPSPYANDLQLVGSDLYALLQRRNGFNPGAQSLILKINTNIDAVTDTIPLQYKNGYAMTYYDSALFVSNPGSVYSVGDGAIEKVDLVSKTVTTIVTEEVLGGNPNQIVYKSGTSFYITNYIGWQNVKVLELDISTGAVITLPAIKDAFGGICYDSIGDILYVGERDSIEMGIRIFKNNVQVAGPIKSENSLPPSRMALTR